MIIYLGSLVGYDTTGILKQPSQFLDRVDIDKDLIDLAIEEVYVESFVSNSKKSIYTSLNYTLHHNFYARLNNSKYASLLALTFQVRHKL
jgi:hypothetical protein